MEKQFRAGASMVEITPTPGLHMDGYMARSGASIGIHDPLSTAVLVIEYEGQHAALVTLDVMGVSRSFTDDVRHNLAALLRTSQEAILICASHTHAGPCGLQDWSPIGSGALDDQLAASVHTSIQQAAEQAHDRQHPVRLHSAVGDISGIGGDRNRPEHPVDTRVSVLSFEGGDDEPEAILFHYACHPTVLSAENLEYSADFPGAARRRIRERYPNAVCLFVNGAAGNVSTRFHRRNQSFEEVNRMGGLLGDRVLELVNEGTYNDPALHYISETLALPLREFPVEARQVEPSGNARIDAVRAEGANIESRLYRALHGRESQQAEVCALQIGTWTLLTVPGEAFNDLAYALRQVSSRALVTGYANDYLGYFPTQAAISEATYEALSSPFDARAHTLLQDHLTALMRHVQSI
jgi:neutral/alkaline ceramidase-like enzyme